LSKKNDEVAGYSTDCVIIMIVTAIGTGFKNNTQDIKPLRDRVSNLQVANLDLQTRNNITTHTLDVYEQRYHKAQDEILKLRDNTII